MIEEMLLYEVEHGAEMIQLEDVPTWVCEQCDHTHLEPNIVETVEDMLAHLDTMQSGASEEQEG